METSRRTLIRQTVALAALSALPANAAPILSPSQRAALAAFADTLAPGSAAARVAEFVGAMLASDEPMLCYGYLGVPIAPVDFYRASLDAIDSFAQRLHGKVFAALNAEERRATVGALLAPNLAPWSGPPPSLIYFVIRNDALDALFGSPDAYEKLGIPYMAHIDPPVVKAWTTPT